MRTTLQNLSLLFLVITILASCSMQKRRYNKGWHVEWANRKTPAPKNGEASPITVYNHHPAPSDKPGTIAVLPAEKPAAEPIVTAEAPDAPASKQIQTVPATGRSLDHSTAPSKFRSVDTSMRLIRDAMDDNTDTLGLLSFIFALVGLVTGIGFLLALIFGAIALQRYREGRGTPEKRIFAQLGFLIGLIALIILLFVLLLIFAWAV